MGTVFPLRRAGSGGFEIERGPHPDSLQPRDVRMINGVLRLLSNHLAVLGDYGRGPLTGLLNRRTFDQSFDKIVERPTGPWARDAGIASPSWFADRGYRPVQVDQRSYGHLSADDVLLLVARLMRQAFAAPITVFRFRRRGVRGRSGEHTGDNARGDTGAQFRRRVAEQRSLRSGRFTISIGYRGTVLRPAVSCAIAPTQPFTTPEQEQGRNQIGCYERPDRGRPARKARRVGRNIEFF